MNPKRKPRVSYDPEEAPKYQQYCLQWRAGTSIPDLAEQEGCTNKEMIERIALACKVKRFGGQEMRQWKRECNRIRRRRGELPPI